MEEWRGLAMAVSGTLMSVGFDIDGLLDTVAAAHTRLPALMVAVHERQAEAPHGDIGDNLATQLVIPGENLDGAIRELARLGALHAGSGHALLLYGGRVGLEGSDDAPWLAWQLHHADAVRHAEAALRRLRAAASRARAFEDAIRSAWSFPRYSPRWNVWMSTAIDLVLFARISARMASHALRRMNKAIAREFPNTWKVANHR